MQFFLSSDDGARLYVDGVLILNRWGSCCDTWHADPLQLHAGTHDVELVYHQDSGDAFVELGWQRFQGCPEASPLVRGTYLSVYLCGSHCSLGVLCVRCPDRLYLCCLSLQHATFFALDSPGLIPGTEASSSTCVSTIHANYGSFAPPELGARVVARNSPFSVRWQVSRNGYNFTPNRA